LNIWFYYYSKRIHADILLVFTQVSVVFAGIAFHGNWPDCRVCLRVYSAIRPMQLHRFTRNSSFNDYRLETAGCRSPL